MGVYTGVTPCADCEGIYTRLEFIDSVTYIKSSKYLGKSSRSFLDMGQWSIQNDSVIAITAHGTSQHYLCEGTALVMLNQEGKRIKGPLANYYKLMKGEPEGKKNWNTKIDEGVDFVALGNEPSWSMELDFDKNIRFTTLDGDSVVTRLPKPSIKDYSISYTIASESDTLQITFSPVGCINNMSGAYSDYSVEVKLNDQAKATGCGEFISPLYDLMGTWILSSIAEEVAKTDDFGNGLPELRFNVIEKNVTGSTGCNRLAGSFQLTDSTLHFLPLATTRMFCQGKGENKFLTSLHQVTGYKIEGEKLLLTKGERVLLTFTAKGL
jgi:heat shock protein HslJ/uncharacterized membrane protein/uncharacterized lipoprotein NlpE involved in copper resistance